MEYGNVNNFENLISNDVVLVDFFANWCGPCKMLSPVLDDIASERSNVKIVKVDVDKNEELAKKYGIMSIPTLLLFKNGQVIDKHIGYISKDMLIEMIGK